MKDLMEQAKVRSISPEIVIPMPPIQEATMQHRLLSPLNTAVRNFDRRKMSGLSKAGASVIKGNHPAKVLWDGRQELREMERSLSDMQLRGHEDEWRYKRNIAKREKQFLAK